MKKIIWLVLFLPGFAGWSQDTTVINSSGNGKFTLVSEIPSSPDTSIAETQYQRAGGGNFSMVRSLHAGSNRNLSPGKSHNSTRVEIYPNPTNGSFKITAFGSKIKSVPVFNFQGQQIMEIVNPESAVVEGNIANFSQGIYLIRIMDEQKIIHIKKLSKL
jgi:hypothetical protein